MVIRSEWNTDTKLILSFAERSRQTGNVLVAEKS